MNVELVQRFFGKPFFVRQPGHDVVGPIDAVDIAQARETLNEQVQTCDHDIVPYPFASVIAVRNEKGARIKIVIGDRQSPFLVPNLIAVVNMYGGNVAQITNGQLHERAPALFVSQLRDIVVLTNMVPDERIKYIAGARSEAIRAATFIDAAVRSSDSHGSILVHCWAGMNRSALALAAYLILHHDMHWARAIYLIRAANDVRGISTLTNPHFVEILQGL